ncbi:MAG: response regulator [Balneolaceae bacterium]|nr:MAG: response regulator [Balneolaceae bacterium]
MNSRIMLVDDDAGVLFLHELMIQESGLADYVHAFDKAEKALQFLNNREKNGMEYLVFLDINMPGMNGWDFLDKLDDSTAGLGVTVVMVTSSVNRADREMAGLYRRVVDFIEKPITLEICKKLKENSSLSHIFMNE